MNKYRNIRRNGFASRIESNRYDELRHYERAGLISDLKYQHPFQLQDEFVDCHGYKRRARNYICDYYYKVGDKEIVEDVKGFILPDAKFKLTLFCKKYPDITLSIVTKDGCFDTSRIIYKDKKNWRTFDPINGN